MNNPKKSNKTIGNLAQQSINTELVKGGKGGNDGIRKEAMEVRRNIPIPTPDCGLPVHGGSNSPNVQEGKKR